MLAERLHRIALAEYKWCSYSPAVVVVLPGGASCGKAPRRGKTEVSLSVRPRGSLGAGTTTVEIRLRWYSGRSSWKSETTGAVGVERTTRRLVDEGLLLTLLLNLVRELLTLLIGVVLAAIHRTPLRSPPHAPPPLFMASSEPNQHP